MSTSWVIQDAGLDDLHRLAAYFSIVVRPGDLVMLDGELGAGKTTFTRAFLRALSSDDTLEVASPTFSLVQNYDFPRMTAAHIDCYRLEDARELDELGLDDALQSGIALIEWASRVKDDLPVNRVGLLLSDGASDDTRNITIIAEGSWAPRAERLREMMDFVAGTPYAEAQPRYLQGDASARAYARLHSGSGVVVLMDSPAWPDGPPVRDGKPYSQLVHLAEDVKPFVAVARVLEGAGLSVPGILAEDLEKGFLVTSDLGDRVYSTESGEDPSLEVLYRAAVDVLLELSNHVPVEHLPLPGGTTHRLHAFDTDVMMTEADLLIEWYYEALTGQPPSDEAVRSYHDTFSVLFNRVSGQDTAWLLRDYHSPNLLWLPERDGIARVGVIDFQDALLGHAAYDLVSLLQDARRDIPAELEGRQYAHYCDARRSADSTFDEAEFSTAYAVLGAQRCAKILGIFTRLAKRDGKHGYLAHIPRVSAYLERNLAHEELAGLRGWFAEHLPAELRKRQPSI